MKISLAEAMRMPGNREKVPAPQLLTCAPPVTRVQALTESLTLPPPLDRLDDLALSLRVLPFGLFTEFAAAVGADPARLWAWAKDRPVKI
jgi:hypothetical protein